MPAIAAADPINIPASVSPNSLYISPNPCITGGSGTCAVNIVAEVASSTTVTHREIWVGDPVAGTFKLMNCDRAGMVSTSSASWVKLGVSYEFRLYPTSGCPKIIPAGYPLASVTVTGVGQAPTFPSPNVGLNKMDLASQYGGYGSHGDGSEADAAIGTRLAQKSIIDAKRTGAKFLRVAVAGFGPQWKGGMPGLLNLWQSNPNAYWAHVDKMMADLDASGIGIVPSFAFNQLEIPSMTGETLSDMVKNPNSASYTLLKQFVTQFITRYKNDPAMYFYETGNEMSNSADVDIVASCSTQYGAGARECNAKGNISTNDMIGYSTRLSTLIRTLDPSHAITSGYSVPRPVAEHLRASWLLGHASDFTPDTQQQFTTNLDEVSQGYDIVDTHLYPSANSLDRFGITGATNAGLLAIIQSAVTAIGKRFYVGEFGDNEISNVTINTPRPFSSNVLQQVQDDGIAYSSPWIWEFYQFALDHTGTSVSAPDPLTLEPGYTDDFIANIAAANRALGVVIASASTDTTAPIVIITTPITGTTLGSSNEVFAVASDDTSVAKVDFLLDGTLFDTKAIPPYRSTITSNISSGSHHLLVRATDAAGNSATDELVITNGAVTVPLSCTLAGITVADGAGATFYSAPTVNAGSSCSVVSQTRTCNRGTLDGDSAYQYSSCTAPSTSGGGGGGGIITIATTTVPASTATTIAALLAEIQQLTAKLQALLATRQVHTSCVNISVSLASRASGNNVTLLQDFLIGQGLLAASATGFFGPLTQSALERWQSAHGIVSSGTPSTTGFGALGPRTRLSMACSKQ